MAARSSQDFALLVLSHLEREFKIRFRFRQDLDSWITEYNEARPHLGKTHDADLPGCYPDDEGENDRRLITSDTNPIAQQAPTVRSSFGEYISSLLRSIYQQRCLNLAWHHIDKSRPGRAPPTHLSGARAL
jgi:hypothetical protein